MYISPISTEPVTGNTSPAFKKLTILPAAKESISKELNAFYGGEKSLEKLYNRLESVKINALNYLRLKPQKGTEELADLNVKLHNVYVDKAWNTITYLYSMPELSSGLYTLSTKESILKNPVEVFKQAMTNRSAEIHYKYNLPYELW